MLCRHDWRRLGLDEAFYLDLVTDAPSLPEVPPACDARLPLYLLRPFRVASFGHMLRDSFHNVAANLRRLNLLSTRFDLVLWTTRVDKQSENQHVVQKYSPWIADALHMWADLLDECRSDPPGALHHPLRPPRRGASQTNNPNNYKNTWGIEPWGGSSHARR